MKASVVTAYGGPEVMKYQDMPDPEPGAGDVLVRVAGIGIKPEDMIERNGDTEDRYRSAGCRFQEQRRRCAGGLSPIESHF
jgi:NADPH:quinone reductase-like Zn-dependent oxidoreductase